MIGLKSTLLELNKKRSTKTIEALNNASINTVEDLIWVLPRKIIKLPESNSFKFANIDSYFRGQGSVLSVLARPNFKAKGRNKAVLYNITATIKDAFSDATLNLKWFNCYGSIQSKLNELKEIAFIGVVSEFNGQLQIANPDFGDPDTFSVEDGLKIQYPTINTASSTNIRKVVNKIPQEVWNSISENIPDEILNENQYLSRSDAFQYLHGKVSSSDWDESHFIKAQERLIYEEFFTDQVKVDLRKDTRGKKDGAIINITDQTIEDSLSLYPYELTDDQARAIADIRNDLSSGSPMMRLIQGDVGCGKTTVAVLSSFYAIKDGYQSALMCPTESLAIQHYNELLEVFPKDINVKILIGSTPKKEKNEILCQLLVGEIDLIVGTHSLFQDTVKFKNLGFVIIDEQHKFGVQQRLKLVNKGKGAHCIIMSATPIPRSLSLTQYGDLEISLIKTMPSGRKGSQTRVVTEGTFPKFLSFLKTRLEMGEQGYILVPAISESPDQNIRDLENTFIKFQKYFPDTVISPLHGQMNADEKAKAFKDFNDGKIQLLVATSVIEVGINVTNATIMAILNPERFGLSSLHQMRGRVGRGSKPGFCFLITEGRLNPETMHRLQVIEKSSDGFKIAEEDLKIRGEGDLFGAEQSGVVTQKRIANIILHQDILYKVIQDYQKLKSKNIPLIQDLYKKYSDDERIYTTI